MIPLYYLLFFVIVSSYLSETTGRGRIYLFSGFHRCQFTLQKLCGWCIFPSLRICSSFYLLFLYCCLPYVQYISGHEIAILNSPVQKGECAPSIHSWKAPCKWCTSHLEELIVLFYLLISIAHLHACVQNDKETRNCNSHMHRVITWAVAQASFLHSIL
jgi:hypothetical protein